jgi:ElaB/YqjD/DUF883 family membrane-anchored ribosome-binding protein
VGHICNNPQGGPLCSICGGDIDMAIKEQARKEADRFRVRTDTDQDGRVSAAEARARAEREIAKRPWRTVAIVAVVTAIAVAAWFAIAR